jgi:hypothetical protein
MPFPHGQIGPGICALGLKKGLDCSKAKFGSVVHYPTRGRFAADLGPNASPRGLSRHLCEESSVDKPALGKLGGVPLTLIENEERTNAQNEINLRTLKCRHVVST